MSLPNRFKGKQKLVAISQYVPKYEFNLLAYFIPSFSSQLFSVKKSSASSKVRLNWNTWRNVPENEVFTLELCTKNTVINLCVFVSLISSLFELFYTEKNYLRIRWPESIQFKIHILRTFLVCLEVFFIEL